MEVDDADVDSTLLQQFSCMGTTDREVLISQFYKLVGTGVNERDAAFYLDMNNWNLQEAVGAYFDLQSGPPPLLPPPCLVLLDDSTLNSGPASSADAVPPDTTFVRTWRIKNGGREPWPIGCTLRLTHGTPLSEQTTVALPCVAPGDIATVSVQMRSPSQPGIYQSKWRATTADGTHFGEVIWVIVTVQSDAAVLAVAQQMTRLSELGSSPPPPPTHHPPPGGAAGGPHTHPHNPFAEGAPPAAGAELRPPGAGGLSAFSGINSPGRPVDQPSQDADMD